jgi:hypothetical protein
MNQKMALCLVPQGFPFRSGCIENKSILPQISRRLVLPMMAANAVPPTSEFGIIPNSDIRGA